MPGERSQGLLNRQRGNRHPTEHSARFGAARTMAMMSVAGLALLLAGCNSNPGRASLDTNLPLAPAKGTAGSSTPGTVVWRSPDLARYERAVSAYYIPPATVYRGSGSDFYGLNQQQQEQVAAELTSDVRAAVGRRFKVVNQAGPNAFTLELMLVKIVPPQPTAIQNGPYDFSVAAIGMPDVPSMSTGVMTVSGKFIDGASGKLLVAFVAPVTPQNMDMAATDDPAATPAFAKIASERFASDLVAAIERTRQANRQVSAR